MNFGCRLSLPVNPITRISAPYKRMNNNINILTRPNLIKRLLFELVVSLLLILSNMMWKSEFFTLLVSIGNTIYLSIWVVRLKWGRDSNFHNLGRGTLVKVTNLDFHKLIFKLDFKQKSCNTFRTGFTWEHLAYVKRRRSSTNSRWKY